MSREADGAQALVASGTGMPTLRALRTLRRETALPVLSSNLCLAWCLLRAVAPELAPTSPVELLAADRRLCHDRSATESPARATPRGRSRGT